MSKYILRAQTIILVSEISLKRTKQSDNGARIYRARQSCYCVLHEPATHAAIDCCLPGVCRAAAGWKLTLDEAGRRASPRLTEVHLNPQAADVNDCDTDTCTYTKKVLLHAEYGCTSPHRS